MRCVPEALAKDPDNRWLSRGPRVRLDAEVVRDQALAVSGLLSKKRGGPSVFPPQPPNVTTEGTYGALSWNVSSGEDRFRRSLYTFTKRTSPFALTATFDAPSGEACVARREVTNTPMQALSLLNDVTFMEAARELGKATADAKGDDQKTCGSLPQDIGSPSNRCRVEYIARILFASADAINRRAVTSQQDCQRFHIGESDR